MDPTLLLILTVFVILTAIAMIAQACALVGVLFAVKRLEKKVNGFLPEATQLVQVTKQTVSETKQHASDISKRATEILDTSKDQLAKIDGLLSDATTRARVQLEHAEMVLDDAMSRTQQTVRAVQRGVLSPIREVHGVLSGIRAGIAALGRANRPTVDRATADEEMFI
jgi:F0F1-type ATP synthase membrane subunit b/b'